MNYSLILRTSNRLVLTLLLMFAFFLLLRGHNDPGGGFVGGLVAAGGLALYAISDGPQAVRNALFFDPRTLIAVGLLVAVGTGISAFFFTDPFLTAQWGTIDIPGLDPLALGTPLLFDVGVFIVVLGVAQTIILELAEE